MVNGDYLPECTNCSHYALKSDSRCNLHQVVLPSLETETICVDWSPTQYLTEHPHYTTQTEAVLKNPAFINLKKDTLYYDASYAQTSVSLHYAELKPFRSLLKIVCVEAYSDDDTWVMYLASYGGGDHRYRHFPPVGDCAVMMFGEERVAFEVREGNRRFLWFNEDSDALKKWLDSFVDVETLWKETQAFNSKHYIENGIRVFVEVRQRNKEYTAIPAVHFYPEQLRR
jgi:hypothetical protein